MVGSNKKIAGSNGHSPENDADDFDGSWKEALNIYLYQCLELLAPNLFSLLNTNVKPEFLDKELQSIFSKSKYGRRIADKLVKVQLKSGYKTLLLIHIEVESRAENQALHANFAKRMYEYYVLIQQYFAKYKIYSLGILLNSIGLSNEFGDQFTSSDGRVDYLKHSVDIFGNKLKYSFQVIHLAKWKDKTKQLKVLAKTNPFAIIVLAQIYALKEKSKHLNPKVNIVRMLGEYGYDKQTRRHLLNLVDWIIKLPKDLQPQFLNSIAHKDKNMEYVNSFVRYGMEQGLEKGLEKGMERGQISGQINMLLTMLEHRFGILPNEIRTKIDKASSDQIKDWSLKLIDAEKIEDIFS